MAAGANAWMGRYTTPSKKDFLSWMKSQKGQFNPIIGTLTNQMALLRPENSELVKQYQSVMGRIPGAEQVSAAYAGKAADFAKSLSGMDFARAGQGVSDIVKGAAGAIGADTGTAADAALAAGTVSGMGGQGGDVYSKALLGGAASRFAGLEADTLKANEANRQAMMLGLGEAQDKASAQRMELGRMLADVKGKKRGAVQNPFDVASMFMQYQAAQKALKGSGGSGGSSTTTPTPTGTTGGNSFFNRILGSVGSDLSAKEAQKLYQTGAYQSTMGLQGLMGGKKK